MTPHGLSKPALVILLLAALAVAFVSLRSVEKSPADFHQRNDFAHYVIESQRLIAGQNPYRLPITSEYAERGFINRPAIDRATNPPALLALFLPFALLPPVVGFWLWTVAQLGALAYVLRTCVLRLGVGSGGVLFGGLAAAGLAMYPVVAHIEYAQTQLLLLALTVWGCGAYADHGRATALGPFLWGIATSLKLFTWPLGLLALTLGGIRSGLIFFAGFSLLQLPLLLGAGSEAFMDYATLSIPYIQSTVFQFNGSNSLTGAIRYSMEALSAQQPPLELVHRWNALSVVVLLLLGGGCACRWGRQETPTFLEVSRRAGVMLLLSCAFSPTSWNHYLVLAVLPLLVLLALTLNAPRVSGERRELNLLSALIAYLLIGLSQGRVTTAGMSWTVISSWWGLFACGYLLWLLRFVPPRRDTA